MQIDAGVLAPGGVVAVDVDGQEFVVWRGRSGRLGSAPRVCPHLDHDLAEGYVVGDDLVCPGHGWAFTGNGEAYKRNEFGRADPKGRVATLTLRDTGARVEVSTDASAPADPAVYPPDRHLLRDLRLSFAHDEAGTSRAWMPVVTEVCATDGAVRSGALATLVDVIGGGLAARAAQPDWIATADLTLHVTGAATAGRVEARARVVHAGRTTVVIEVTLHDDSGAELGLATMSFARLPRRDENPDLSDGMTTGVSSMARPSSGMQTSLLDEIGVVVVDAARGVLEAPVRDWSRNSLGSMQGGSVAAVIDGAAEAASRAGGDDVVVTDLQLTYLALARVGPIRTRVEVLDARPGVVTTRVELIDAGSNDRVTTVGRVVATTSLRGNS